MSVDIRQETFTHVLDLSYRAGSRDAVLLHLLSLPLKRGRVVDACCLKSAANVRASMRKRVWRWLLISRAVTATDPIGVWLVSGGLSLSFERMFDVLAHICDSRVSLCLLARALRFAFLYNLMVDFSREPSPLPSVLYTHPQIWSAS